MDQYQGFANIFSIPSLKNLGYHITYDSDDRYYLATNRKTDISTKFIEDKNGLPYVEAANKGLMFVQTVRQNYEGFTNKEVEKALLHHKGPGLLGNPYEQELKYLVSSNLDECPGKIPDVESAHKRFGPILGGCMEKPPKKIHNMCLWTMLLFPEIFWSCTSM